MSSGSCSIWNAFSFVLLGGVEEDMRDAYSEDGAASDEEESDKEELDDWKSDEEASDKEAREDSDEEGSDNSADEIDGDNDWYIQFGRDLEKYSVA
jgi:hypothetical protein